MSSHSLHQEICLTQGLNPGLPHCRQILYHLSPQGSPYKSWLRTSVTFCYLEPVLGFLIPGLLQHACFIKAYKKKENYRVYYQEKNITLFCNQIIELIASVCGHTVLLIKNKSLNGNELCKAENPRGWDQVRPPEWLPVAMVVLIAQLFPTLRKPRLLPRFLCPWNSPGKNTAVGCHSLLQGIFPPRDWTWVLPHWRKIPYSLSHWGSLS